MNTVLRHYLLFCLLVLGQIAIGQDAGLNIANTEIKQLAEDKNYSPTDIQGTIVSDDYTSRGIRHIYYQQTIDNIGVYGTSGAVHLKEDQVIASNLNFLPQLDKRNVSSQFRVQALEALARLAIDQGYPLSQTEVVILETNELAPEKNTLIQAEGISNRVIPLKLVYFTNQAQEIQLAWSVFIDEVADAEYKNYMVSAETGAVLFEENLTITCTFDHDHNHDHGIHQHRAITGHSETETGVLNNASFMNDSLYNVLPFTIESPNFGNRAILANPWENSTASPNGWHHISGVNSQYTAGNNVDAYTDRDNTNAPTGGNAVRAFGGPDLVFDHSWDPNGTQTDYSQAAVTNLFYMNNVAHDIFYNYGFDEASGNFQEDNFGKGGNGSDAVRAEAQDGLGTCNANMSTPGDGGNPRMQMYLCGGQDGDYDNGVILHEFGHGISNRLTGGPQAVGCLTNVEQMGEGWSDFFGMLLTMKATDVATTNRTIGTFMFNQDANGAGLRPYPYTTDMSVNPMTYKTIDDPGISRPHGVGAVWATMLWDLNWALINQYGWDADLYNGTGGNNIALHLVMEGLKLQPCSPGFVDGRDAILAADVALYGGVNRCLIWEVFARRGLGYSADQGSTNSRTDGSEGYDMPPACTIELNHTVDKTNAFLGERLTFQLEAVNHLDAIASNIIITDTLPDNVQFYSASDGGVLNGNVVQWPAFNLPVGGTKTLELKVTVNDVINFEANFLDDLESGGTQWAQVQKSGTHTWDLQSQYYYSSANSWFISNANTTTETHLVLKDALALTNSSELTFNHYFDLETSYDFGLVEISIDGGDSWNSLESNFTQNGYNKATVLGYNAFSAASTAIVPNISGFITSKADLSPYAGKVALIRFRVLTDINTNRFGWIVDDIGISNTNYALPNFSNIRNNDYNFDTKVNTPVIISHAMVNHTVETVADTLITLENATALFADVQANDIDGDGLLDTLVTTILQTATNGTAIVTNEDSISYTPNANFIGRDTVVYQVCDEANACEADTLFVFVLEQNLAPVTQPDYLTINENSSNHFINVQANDSDPNGAGDSLKTTILESTLHGTAVVINDDSISYTPITTYFGLDTIIYQVCDTANLCDTDTVFITIKELNKTPIAQSDYSIVLENSTNNFINVQANDTDPNGVGDSLVTTILETALHGTAVVMNEDSISYSPTMYYFGLDTIVYQICDTANLCDTDTVFITINNINYAPVAHADYTTVFENSTNNFINVQANDIDNNGAGDSLITTIMETALHGTATIVNEDSISYSPIMDYYGFDTIIYQVCDTANLCSNDTVFITIKELNKAPSAQTDHSIVLVNSTNNFINIQANDSDPNGVGDSLLTTILETALHGTATVINEDSISYSPMMDYFGLDTIVYQVCDTANLCASDTIFITIDNTNYGPVTNTDYSAVIENSLGNYINVQANDSDPNGVGDSLLTTILETALHGTATVINEDSISYSPMMDYYGLDTIVYQVCDTANLCASDTIFITINYVNEVPIAVKDFLEIDKNTIDNFINVQANDSDPNGAGDTLITSILSMPSNGIATVINTDSISYTPITTYFGLDTIVYQVCDTAGLCASDTVLITINDYNEAPITISDTLEIKENTINNYVDVQANDIDPNGMGDTLVTILVKAAANGSTIVVNEDSIRYTPVVDFVGLDTVIYQVCDTSNLCTTDTLFIFVSMENLPPIAKVDFDTLHKNSKDVFIDVQANDVDPNGLTDILATSILAGAFHGSASVVDADGLVYTPTTDYFGADTIVYEICDLAGRCDSDTVFLAIKDVLLCSSDNLVKDDSDISDGNYVAAAEITSSGAIKNGTTVKFVAGDNITLLPGFIAEAGADFTAMIDDCESVVADAEVIEEISPVTTDRNSPDSEIQENGLIVRPNPFRGSTIIDYELAIDSPVWIGLHDITGKVLHVFVNQSEQVAGKHQYHLSAAQLPSGAYWVSMRTVDTILTKKIIVLQN